MKHRDYIFLVKIKSEILFGMDSIKNTTEEQFLNDEIIKRAICMTAINVGELVKGLTAEFTKKYCRVPWKKIAGFRDIAAHKYETLNMADVYEVVKKDFPDLLNEINNIFDNEIDEKQ